MAEGAKRMEHYPPMGAGAAIGAILGAGLVAKVKASTLKALFGILFLYVSLKYILRYFGIAI